MIEEKSFSAEELNKIDLANDLKIAPLRADGKTIGTPTWIWNVVVDGELYVRAYNGINSHWYISAIKQKEGQIHATRMIKEVFFESVSDEALQILIDKAYHKKYADSPYLPPMVSKKAKAATIHIIQK